MRLLLHDSEGTKIIFALNFHDDFSHIIKMAYHDNGDVEEQRAKPFSLMCCSCWSVITTSWWWLFRVCLLWLMLKNAVSWKNRGMCDDRCWWSWTANTRGNKSEEILIFLIAAIWKCDDSMCTRNDNRRWCNAGTCPPRGFPSIPFRSLLSLSHTSN